MSSIGFFDTAADSDESTRLASNWVHEQKLEPALPPKITSGEVVVHKTSELVPANSPEAVRCRREGPRLRGTAAGSIRGDERLKTSRMAS